MSVSANTNDTIELPQCVDEQDQKKQKTETILERIEEGMEIAVANNSSEVDHTSGKRMSDIESSPPKDSQVREKISLASSESKNEEQDSVDRTIRRRHIALHVYYDGSNYSGLAENIGRSDDISIERHLFDAMMKSNLIDNTNRQSCHYSRCGRTDRGVSASGQVVALHLKSSFHPLACHDENGMLPVPTADLPNNSHEKIKVWVPPRPSKSKTQSNGNEIPVPTARVQRTISEYAYDKILNNLLPPDIRILGWTSVTDDFSARFSTVTRTYRYFFVKSSKMDLNRVQSALNLLIGSHDFRNFCKMDVEKVYNFERKIYSANVVETNKDSVCYLQIVGQAFLWHQIRCIAHIILSLIGNGYEEPTVISELLNIQKYSGKPSYPLADEKPLVLHECSYNNLSIQYSVSNLWSLQCLQQGQCQQHLLHAARIQNCLEYLQGKSVSVTDLVDFCKTRKNLIQRKQKALPKKFNTMEPKALVHNLEENYFQGKQLVSWNDAMQYMKELNMIPEPESSNETISYKPLLLRSMGTTYEEKVDALLNHNNNSGNSTGCSKRQARYTENVIRKRKTKIEDAIFYDHMTKQGSFA